VQVQSGRIVDRIGQAFASMIAIPSDACRIHSVESIRSSEMWYIRYVSMFGEDSRMWEVVDNKTDGTVAWYEYANDAADYAADLNTVEAFEYSMEAYNADTY
jgi:hypothetical protein